MISSCFILPHIYAEQCAVTFCMWKTRIFSICITSTSCDSQKMAQFEAELKVTKVVVHRKSTPFRTTCHKSCTRQRKTGKTLQKEDAVISQNLMINSCFFCCCFENKGKACFSKMEALGKIMKEQDCTSGAERIAEHMPKLSPRSSLSALPSHRCRPALCRLHHCLWAHCPSAAERCSVMIFLGNSLTAADYSLTLIEKVTHRK